ncbi:hypothetical protein [Homoserinimonas hongtaonis]|uniref:DUF8094 domain-containing protein n=1 Tax=Homoserinimonas hongtaonis TaxID=2079791 RepID=A0A2U1SZJ7_9MICO|nr:hypothetical protein [Salinibacterium hongtaonis]PWB97037.1 hypothetical protein DF220_03680 [Salinibacterium hongtaonis]
MRFVAAIVSFVLAFVLIGLGLAQRTVFAGPDEVVAEATFDSEAPVAIIDEEALQAFDGRQTIDISGSDQVIAAYGRSEDVTAWVGLATHTVLTVDEETGEVKAKLVKGDETTVPSAIGSDLWFAEYSGESAVSFSANIPEGISVIFMADGTQPAPDTVSISWPTDPRTPWTGPLIVAGVILLLLGGVLYFWAFRHWRKTRGPRRKQPKQPKEPKLPRQPRYSNRKAAKAVRPSNPAGTDSSAGRRSSRKMIAIPVVLVGSLVFTGCSADNWPQLGGGSEPSVAASAEADSTDAGIKDPAVTEKQLARIMDEVATVATEADAATSEDLLATRFEGPAYEVRAANYIMRRADPAQPLPQAIVGAPIALSLPQQTDAWPRVVLVVVQDADDETVVPTAVMLEQATPRENYKAQYAVKLQATEFPDVAASTVGAVRYSPDNKFLKLAPEEVFAAYSDILLVGAASTYAEQFDLETDTFIGLAGPDARAARAASVSGPATLSTALTAGSGSRIALATDNTGAIITLSFNDTETITPTEANATIALLGSVKLLTGLSETKKGVNVTYGYQLLFYVPPAGSDEKIRLLGATEGVISAGELP